MPNQSIKESASIGRIISKELSKADRATPNIIAFEGRVSALENTDSTHSININNLDVRVDSLETQTSQIVNSVLQTVYGIGCIYITTVASSPVSLLGFGVWVRIGSGRTLIDSGTSYPAGSVGGAAWHTLTESEMPSHRHLVNSGLVGSNAGFLQIPGHGYGGAQWSESTGGGAAHNNMPPYLACYIWKRTA